jgi:hypothetical protein
MTLRFTRDLNVFLTQSTLARRLRRQNTWLPHLLGVSYDLHVLQRIQIRELRSAIEYWAGI